MDNVLPGPQRQFPGVQGNDQSRKPLCKLPCGDISIQGGSAATLCTSLSASTGSAGSLVPSILYHQASLMRANVRSQVGHLSTCKDSVQRPYGNRPSIATVSLCFLSMIVSCKGNITVCAALLHDVVGLEPRFEVLSPGSLLVRADLAPLPVSPIWYACQLCCHLQAERLHLEDLTACVSLYTLE